MGEFKKSIKKHTGRLATASYQGVLAGAPRYSGSIVGVGACNLSDSTILNLSMENHHRDTTYLSYLDSPA